MIQCMLLEAMASELIYGSLRKLSFLIHENCICFLELIYNHLKAQDYLKISKETIETILINKKGKLHEEKTPLKILVENNKSIMKIINKLMKLKSGSNSASIPKQTAKKGKSVQSTISNVLKSIEDLTIDIESARAQMQVAAKDSPQIPQIKGPFSLPVLKGPFLPELKDEEKSKTYTLVLDLDETLVHMQNIGIQGKLLIRPGAREFLGSLSQYYEIVIYTAALSDVIIK